MPITRIDGPALGDALTGVVTLGGTDASAYGGRLNVTNGGQATAFFWNFGIGSGHIGVGAGSSNIKIYNTYADGLLANGKGVDIDTQGRVTVANQPYAYARCGTVQSTYNFAAGTTHIMQYNSAPVNIGSAWNTSTYRFTAPAAGRYFVYAHAQINGTAGSWAYNFGIWRNGSIQDGVYEGGNSLSYQKMHVTGIVSCAVNDFIDIRVLQNVTSGSIEYGSPDQRFACHIHLLG
jgi:hypothetical protein